MNLKVREQIKSLIAKENITLKEVAGILEEKTNKTYSLANLSSKLKRGTLTYNEVVIIADVLGYKIEFIDKNS